MADHKLQAELREAQGKNQVDKLRANGILPGVLYQRDGKNVNVQVDELEFNRVYGEVGTSTLLDIELSDGSKRTVLIKEVQKHPFKNQYLHIDFQGVRMDEAIKVTVPVVLLNRDEVRVQPSVISQMLDEVEIECLPAYIPQTAEVNVEDMQYGDVMTVADLDIASNKEITILADKTDVVCTLSAPQDGSAVEEEEVSAADVPQVGEEDAE